MLLVMKGGEKSNNLGHSMVRLIIYEMQKSVHNSDTNRKHLLKLT